MLPGYPASQTSQPARVVRRHARLLYSMPLTLHHLAADGVRSSRGISLDISESGIGALVEAALQVGETVSLELELPNYDLQAVAIVRNCSSAHSGFEFLGLTPGERQRIASLVERA